MMCAKIIFTKILKTDMCSARFSCNSVLKENLSARVFMDISLKN